MKTTQKTLSELQELVKVVKCFVFYFCVTVPYLFQKKDLCTVRNFGPYEKHGLMSARYEMQPHLQISQGKMWRKRQRER
jgi:hypothetical protein